MQPARVDVRRGVRAPDPGEFFIPDICGPRPVFLMILLSELMVLVYTLAESSLPRFDWSVFATSSLLVQWVVLLSALLLCWLRHPFSRLSLQLAAAGSLVVVVAVTAVSSLAALIAFPRLPGTGDPHWWLLRNLLVAFVLAAIVLRYFFLQQQLRVQEQLELQARLDSLRARIRPHFLFNTLNSIASLIMSRPEAAERAVEDLSELFRASLKESYGETSVADELRLCELYLGIEQLRLGDRLRIEWQVQENLRDAPMPSLVLQPLVENAVYHGLARLPAGGCIRISIEQRGACILATVENPVPAQAAESSGLRMALANVEQRLQATYGTGASLRVFPDSDSFRVQLSYTPGAS